MYSVLIALIYFHLRLTICIAENATCLATILKEYGSHQSVFAYDEEPWAQKAIIVDNTSYVVANLKLPLSDVHLTTKFYFFLIQISNVTTLDYYLESIYRSRRYNAKAKMVIVFEGNTDALEDLFKVLWNFYLVHVLVLTKERKFYTYYPISEGKCGRSSPRYLFDCDSIDFTKDIFTEGSLTTFDGCKIKISALIGFDYYVSDSDDFQNNTGLELAILREILVRIKLKPDFSLYKSYVANGMDRNYMKLMLTLGAKQADIVFGFTMLQEHLAVIFDYSFITFFPKFSFFVPLAKRADPWKNIFLIFQWKIWLGIGICMMSITLCIYFLDGRKHSLIDCLIIVINYMFSVVPRLPVLKRFRILLYWWFSACFILSSAYQCLMVSFLFKPIYQKQIETVEDIVDSGLPFGGYYWLRNYIDPTVSNTFQTIYDEYQNCSMLLEHCINYLLSGHFCYLADTRSMADNAVRINYKQIYMMPPIMTLYVTYYLDKGSPFTASINEHILMLREGGFLEKWDKYNVIPDTQQKKNEFQKLGLIHLQAAFLIYFGGVILSISVFFYEFLSRKLCKH